MRALMTLTLPASLLALEPTAAHACATVVDRASVVVPIADEEALIVWDAATHTEHFIRRATFASEAPRDFGFLVPTPTAPELAEASESTFQELARRTEPRVEYRPELGGIEPTSLCFLTFGRSVSSKVAALDESVRVLSHAQVGGYDATVLSASDPAALATWLSLHGYDSRPTLRDWLAPYIAAGWKLTAFKIAPAAGQPVTTSPVRLTFHTDRPFFPYREPAGGAETAGPSRLLRVYFLADQRHDGAIGDGRRPWAGTTEQAGPITVDSLDGFATEKLGKPRYLTLFEDRSSPRPAVDELYFSPSTAGDQARLPIVVPAPYRIPLPVELVGLGLLAWLLVRTRRRRREARSPS